MKLDFETKGRVIGSEFFACLRDAFPMPQWPEIGVVVNDVRYDLSQIGVPGDMMRSLLDATSGTRIEVEIPDAFEYDVEEVRAALAEVVDRLHNALQAAARKLRA